MSKLKVSIKKSTVTAMMKAGRKERINETELSQLARIKPCGIMHVTKTKKDSVIYTCPANINLTDRLKKAISKYDFFFMIEQMNFCHRMYLLTVYKRLKIYLIHLSL